MRLNGWWRIAIVIMALFMGFTIFSALTGTSEVAIASLPFDPPYPKNISDPFEAAMACGAACDRYDEARKVDVQRLAVRLGEQRGCISGTTNYERRNTDIAIICRTPEGITNAIVHALLACAVLVLIGLTVGWVAGGFRSSQRPVAQ